jgi:tetratricopeptide (TPR) repeat protein
MRRTGLAVVAAAGVLVFALVHTRTGSHAAAVSPLAPDPEVVHYKFSTSPKAADAELASTIAALEARIRDPQPSPFDLSDLAELYLRQAQQTGDAGAYTTSEGYARRSLAILAEPNAASLTLARIDGARHHFRESIAGAQQFARHAKGAGPYLVMATAHLALGELVQAAGDAETAITRKPDSEAYATRALVMEAQGRDAEAAFDFSHAVALETAGDLQGAARIRTLWARFLVRRGELASATAVLDEALRIVPDLPLAIAQQGELALRAGRFTVARDRFEQAFATSRQLRYLIDQARAEELGGQRAAADASRTQAIRLLRDELATSSLGHQLELVEVLLDRGHADDVAEAVTRAKGELAQRGSSEARFQLARALARAGRRDEALAQCQAALALGVRDARLYELTARVETGPRREMYARLAVELDPEASGWRTLGMP